jgi:uncharacterized repeat protein (TIGR01451 family)
MKKPFMSSVTNHKLVFMLLLFILSFLSIPSLSPAVPCSDTTAIAAGRNHTVGLKQDGTVVAVGDNSSGQLNVSSWTNIKAVAAGYNYTAGLKEDGTVVAVGSIDGQAVSSWTNIKAFAAGNDHMVGLKEDGTVVAVGRGYNNFGQLDVSAWTNIKAIAAGGYHTVGLKEDGTVVAVGWNNFGQLDVSSLTNIKAVAAGFYHTVGLKEDGTVVVVGGDNNYGQMDVSAWTNIKAIAAGGYHTVGLKEDGTVVAVGWDVYDQLAVSSWTNIKAIAAGGFHTVGLKEDGTVVAVGWNENGQLAVSSWMNITAVAAGFYHSVGLRDDGTVVAVGYNNYGQLAVSTWTNIKAVAAGYFNSNYSYYDNTYYTVGLKEDGTVVAVGYNGYGQLDVSSWTNIKAVAAGFYHTVGLRDDGTVVAVGYNNYGQLDVSSWTNIKAVAAGFSHTVGLREDGSVVAVGYNGYGRWDVSSWTNIKAVAAGEYHTVGLKEDGTVVAVGDNSYGQLNVSSWTNIKAVAAGGYHTVGLKEDGTVVAVGDNNYGYLAGGQLNVSSWTNIKAVAAGRYHTVGLKEDGTVVAVGLNNHGQLNTFSWANIMPVCWTQSADLSLSVSSDAASLDVGSLVTYTVTVANNDTAVNATNVKITDSLPAGATFVSASAGCTDASGTVTCDLGILAPAETNPVTITVRAGSSGDITNSAMVSADQSDPDTSNNTGSVTINVNAPPTISSISDQTTGEDTALAVAFTIGDAETAATALTVSCMSPNTALVNVVCTGTDTARTITMQPVLNQTGTAVIMISVSDGTATAVRSFNLTVDSVNDPPTSSNSTVTTNEDVAYVFSTADFPFTDVDTGNTLNQVQITTLPAAGTLTLNGTAVTANQLISAADLGGGLLTFAPADNTSGEPYTTFEFKVSDGIEYSTNSYIMTVDVFNTEPCKGVDCVDAPVTPVPGVEVTFTGEVTAGGQTTASISAPDMDTGTCDGAANFDFGLNILSQSCYDIHTDAVFTGTVNICLTYDDTNLSLEQEQSLTIQHMESGVWQDRTIQPVDTVNNIACGTVSSFSWFVIAYDTTPPTFTLNRLEDTLSENNEMVKVATVTDVSDAADPSPDVDIQVTSNQSIDGDWNVQQTGDEWEVWVRAERSGSNDRIYTIDAAVTDKSGNRATAMHTVRVEHD